MNTNIQTLIEQASFPVYGIVGNFFGLTLYSAGNSSRNGIFDSITLGFSLHNSMQSIIRMELTSLDGQDEYTRRTSLDTLQENQPGWSRDQTAFIPFGRTVEQQSQLGQSQVLKVEPTIASQMFTGEIHYWSIPPQPAWFTLMNEQTILFGAVLGLSKDELQSLLQAYTHVNGNTNLITQYQQDFDHHWRAHQMQ